jgi:hypothetical protein
MDYLIENNQPSVILHGAGIPVRVPDPARFALHKLALSQLRPAAMKAKADKDLRQAGAILEVLLVDNPGLVMLAADALNERSDMMANFTRKGALLLQSDMKDEIIGMIPEKKWDTHHGVPRHRNNAG